MYVFVSYISRRIEITMDNFDQKCHASLVRCVKCGEGRLAFSFKVEKPVVGFPLLPMGEDQLLNPFSC